MHLTYSEGLFGQLPDNNEAMRWKAEYEATARLRGSNKSINWVIAGLYKNGWGVAKNPALYDFYIGKD